MARDLFTIEEVAWRLASLYGLVDTEALIRIGLAFGLKPEDWVPETYTLQEEGGRDGRNVQA